jgi:putative ATPase
MDSLFSEDNDIKGSFQPLADRVRPKSIDEFIGQEHVVGKDGPLGKMIRSGCLSSFLIYGPPGTGKTTIARIAASTRKTIFISATTAHIKDIRSLIKELAKEKAFSNRTPVLIIDEIQHFNRKEQDAFLNAVENGDIILIALTTENPSFYINNALLSRLSIFHFHKLTDQEIKKIIYSAIEKDSLLKEFQFDDDAVSFIASVSDGDARKALNLLDIISQTSKDKHITRKIAEQFASRMLSYGREQHYDIISAFIKSMRGSNADAALYYFYRMIRVGEDPLYIGRRMIRFAAEDIGLANSNALIIANSAFDGFQKVGPPEGYLVLAEAVVYLSKCKKSNALYVAEKKVLEEIEKSGDLEVPKKLRNPVTKLMRAEGYGKGYKYPHNYPDHFVENETYLPDKIKDKKFYEED